MTAYEVVEVTGEWRMWNRPQSGTWNLQPAVCHGYHHVSKPWTKKWAVQRSSYRSSGLFARFSGCQDSLDCFEKVSEFVQFLHLRKQYSAE